MITLVTGGSGSGKSEYAEQLVLDFGDCRRYYVATMEAYGEEGRRRVLRHRKLRHGKGFLTLERQRDLEGLKLSEEGPRAVLLECISNLAANEMFGAEPPRELEKESRLAFLSALEERICRGVLSLAAQSDELVIVTNEVGADGEIYEKETMEYIDLLGRVNSRLAALSHQVVEVVYGIGVPIKQMTGGRNV